MFFYRKLSSQILSAQHIENRAIFANIMHRKLLIDRSIDVENICFFDESMIMIAPTRNRAIDGYWRDKGDPDFDSTHLEI